MSLAEVQARTAELQQRLQELSGSRAARGVLGSASATSGTAAATGTTSSGSSFAQQLRSATASSGGSAGLAVPASVSSTRTATTTAGTTASAAVAGTTGEDVVATAKRQLGVNYVWGGESLAEGGFDCSGLMQWAYKQHGVDLPRVSRDQARAGRAVSPTEARPGDLVFFDRATVDHIGMYAGNGKWVVAPRTGDVVKIQSVDLSKATTIRRVLPDGAAAPVSAARGTSALADALPPSGRRYAAQIETAARAAGIDPALLAAVAWTESGFDPDARSRAGAVGLVQLMPRTATGLGVTDRTDPAQSLRGGATYLKQQLAAFDGRTDLALAAYNAGPTAVRRSGGVPPYEETQHYVEKVLSRVRSLGGSA